MPFSLLAEEFYPMYCGRKDYRSCVIFASHMQVFQVTTGFSYGCVGLSSGNRMPSRKSSTGVFLSCSVDECVYAYAYIYTCMYMCIYVYVKIFWKCIFLSIPLSYLGGCCSVLSLCFTRLSCESQPPGICFQWVTVLAHQQAARALCCHFICTSLTSIGRPVWVLKLRKLVPV